MSFSSEPIISATDVSIFQDNNTILTDVNFNIQKGEFVFLVGRTGSGKSSLLRTLYADLAVRLGDLKYLTGEDFEKLKLKVNEISKLISGLIKYLSTTL